ncbi:MAG: hypothetical protein J6I73_08630 [Treponema sp.]|nr:hypothetical protein [Treponema sp.]
MSDEFDSIEYASINKIPNAKIIKNTHLFSSSAIPEDAHRVINAFDEIVQSVFPMNSKQRLSLPKVVRTLSHGLTDERGKRRLGYMNTTATLSAYVRYFSWWNIIRFAEIFANLGAISFPLNDGNVCVDVGSGPLTVVIALWLACPELRNKKLTWYCLDISQASLTLGENLYLSIAARTPPSNKNAERCWKIIRVKGALGTVLHQKAQLVTCADMLNEICDTTVQRDVAFAKTVVLQLLAYGAKKCSVLVLEPGVPHNARIISLMRDLLIEKKLKIIAPCPHEKKCAMDGLNARKGGKSKWCNFVFTTKNTPPALKKIAADAGIQKERIVTSFVLASNIQQVSASALDTVVQLRIASDRISLPGLQHGYYACSEYGLTLAVNASDAAIFSGDLLTVKLLHRTEDLSRDKKSDAVMMYM